jgi:hypothetical protein
MNPYMGNMNPYMGGMNPFMGGMNPYMGNTNPYMGGMNPYMNGVNPYPMVGMGGMGSMNPYMAGMNSYMGRTSQPYQQQPYQQQPYQQQPYQQQPYQQQTGTGFNNGRGGGYGGGPAGGFATTWTGPGEARTMNGFNEIGPGVMDRYGTWHKGDMPNFQLPGQNDAARRQAETDWFIKDRQMSPAAAAGYRRLMENNARYNQDGTLRAGY